MSIVLPEPCSWQVYPGSMETPPEYCDEDAQPNSEYCARHQRLSDDLAALEECRCGHLQRDHQGPEKLGGAQCRKCPGDSERSWRHPFTPKEYED